MAWTVATHRAQDMGPTGRQQAHNLALQHGGTKLLAKVYVPDEVEADGTVRIDVALLELWDVAHKPTSSTSLFRLGVAYRIGALDSTKTLEGYGKIP